MNLHNFSVLVLFSICHSLYGNQRLRSKDEVSHDNDEVENVEESEASRIGEDGFLANGRPLSRTMRVQPANAGDLFLVFLFIPTTFYVKLSEDRAFYTKKKLFQAKSTFFNFK